MKQFSDETQEAFRLTSDSIGKEWRHLYHQLPFDPPRDIQQRERDLEGKQRSQHSLVQEIILNTHKAFVLLFTTIVDSVFHVWKAPLYLIECSLSVLCLTISAIPIQMI